MYSQYFIYSIQVSASIGFLAVLTAVFFMPVILLINYLMARMQADVQRGLYIIGAIIGLLLLLSGGTWGIFISVLALSGAFYWGWQKRVPMERLFWVSLGLLTVLTLLSIVSPFLFFNMNYEQLVKMVEDALNQSVGSLANYGIKDSFDLAALHKQVRQNLAVVKVIFVFLAIFYNGVLAFLLLPVFHFFWKKYQGMVAERSSWINWRLPEHLILLFALFLTMAVLNFYIESKILLFVGANGFLILAMLYAIQGGAVTAYFVSKWKKERALFWFAILLFLIMGSYTLVFFFILFFIIGLSDFWLNFRKARSMES